MKEKNYLTNWTNYSRQAMRILKNYNSNRKITTIENKKRELQYRSQKRTWAGELESEVLGGNLRGARWTGITSNSLLRLNQQIVVNAQEYDQG